MGGGLKRFTQAVLLKLVTDSCHDIYNIVSPWHNRLLYWSRITFFHYNPVAFVVQQTTDLGQSAVSFDYVPTQSKR
jgi:hypothetical protein